MKALKVFVEIVTPSQVACCVLCQQTKRCLGFKFSTDTGMCSLAQTSMNGVSTDFHVNYYE